MRLAMWVAWRFTHLSSWRFFKFFPSYSESGADGESGALAWSLSAKWSLLSDFSPLASFLRTGPWNKLTESIAPAALSEREKKARPQMDVMDRILEKVEIIAKLST
jgi:hypothetical protein